MEISSQLFVAVLPFASLIALYFIARRFHAKPKVLPPPRSRGTELSYQETNSVAKLFLEAASLKESDANWSSVLKLLNAEDEPRIRTLLLELRELNISNPRCTLETIEAVCIESKRESEKLSRADLLERAQLRMRIAER